MSKAPFALSIKNLVKALVIVALALPGCRGKSGSKSAPPAESAVQESKDFTSSLPVYYGAAAEICEGQRFVDASGGEQMGTRACAASSGIKPCDQDGETNCIATPEFAAVATQGLSARIAQGQTVAGITGTAPAAPIYAECASDGATGCLATAAFPAAAAAGLAAKVMNGQTVAGVVGTASVAGNPPNCSQDGETACMSTAAFPAVAASGLASKVISGQTVAGVPGTAPTETHSSCSADGDTGCVVTGPLLAAALTTGLSAKVITGSVVAGVPGSATVESHGSCSVDGATDCVTTSSYKAAAVSGLADKVMSGATVAGVAGTAAAESHSDCSTDGAVGCVTTSGFKSVNMNNAVAGNIRSGVTLGGVAGAYGTACTADGEQGCIASGVFKAANVSGISPWDIRKGQSIAGLSGSMLTSCRNTIRSSRYNWDGAIADLPTDDTNTGTALDFWDTTDDWFGLSSSFPAEWSAAHYLCDSSVWEDVTTVDGGSTVSSCAANPNSCSFRDKISGLTISRRLNAGAWNTAVKACNSSTYGGFAAGTWRLPTQKEMMTLWTHGLASLTDANFSTSQYLTSNFWTSSSYSNNTTYAWYVNLGSGRVEQNYKITATYQYFCVK